MDCQRRSVSEILSDEQENNWRSWRIFTWRYSVVQDVIIGRRSVKFENSAKPSIILCKPDKIIYNIIQLMDNNNLNFIYTSRRFWIVTFNQCLHSRLTEIVLILFLKIRHNYIFFLTANRIKHFQTNCFAIFHVFKVGVSNLFLRRTNSETRFGIADQNCIEEKKSN